MKWNVKNVNLSFSSMQCLENRYWYPLRIIFIFSLHICNFGHYTFHCNAMFSSWSIYMIMKFCTFEVPGRNQICKDQSVFMPFTISLHISKIWWPRWSKYVIECEKYHIAVITEFLDFLLLRHKDTQQKNFSD